VAGLPAALLVGDTVVSVEPHAKHLLIRFASGKTLHTHMRMQGAWYVHPVGERWRRPAWQARIVLEAGDRVAVCFNAPIVELVRTKAEVIHPALSALGPDILVQPLAIPEILARAGSRPRSTEVGDLLLDQRVISGIGNIFRCESLFVARLHPCRLLASIDDHVLTAAVEAAARLMIANTQPGSSVRREFGLGAGERWVYRRTRRPCRRCGTAIQSARVGQQARTAYWCPTCQPPP
jgi:endonuclease-8